MKVIRGVERVVVINTKFHDVSGVDEKVTGL
jgi:hypothetical protein